MRILAFILIVFLVLLLLHWGGIGWGFAGGYGFPLIGVVVLVCLIVWILKGAPMP